MNFIMFLIIGAIAGWLAGTIMKGRGFGLLGNMVVGIVGAFIGGFLFSAASRLKVPLYFLLFHRAILIMVDDPALAFGGPGQQHFLDDLR